MDVPIDRLASSGADRLGNRFAALGSWLYVILAIAAIGHLFSGESQWAPSLGAFYGWWVALTFVILQVAIGRRLRQTATTRTLALEGATECLVSLTLGFWLSSVALLALGWLNLLNWVGVVLYLLATGALVLSPVSATLKSIRERLSTPLDRWLVWAAVLAVLMVAAMFPILVRSFLPNADWDGASTHLPLAQWFASQGLGAISLDYSNLIIPGTVHLVYALFLAINAEQAIIPLNLIFSALTCLATAVIARRFWGEVAARWAFGIALSINLLLEVGLDPRIDGFLAFFCTMGALGILGALLEEEAGPAWIVLSGASLGTALGAKYTTLFSLFLWAIPVAWFLGRRLAARNERRYRSGLVLAMAMLVVPSSFWYLSNFMRFGDPLYPRLKGEVLISKNGDVTPLQPAVDRLINEARADAQFNSIVDETRLSQSSYSRPPSLLNPLSPLLEPNAHARKPVHTVSPLLLLFVLLPVLRRDNQSWLLLWMGASVFLAIGSQTYLVRYGLPVYPLLAVGAGVAIASVAARWWRVGWGAVLITLLSWNAYLEWGQVRSCRPWLWLTGSVDRLEWLSQVGYNHEAMMPVTIEKIHALKEQGVISGSDRVFMYGEAKSHLLRLDALPDISRTGRPWLARMARNDGDLNDVHEEMWSNGIRFVLLNLSYIRWVRGNLPVDPEEIVYSLLSIEQLVQAHGEVVLDEAGMILVRLQPPLDGVV